MQNPETVEVQREKSEDNPTGIVVINKEDFNPEIDKLVEAAAPAVEAVVPAPEASVVTETPAAPVVEEAPAAAAEEEKKPWAK